jgi:hypothetical protein
MNIEPADRDDPIELERGVTRVLTDEGWDDALYVDPGDDWALLDDGSWSSPDGRTRSWPVLGAEPPPNVD